MTNQPEEWMTIREAALALNVSELTVRRRIKDGRVAHRLINGKYYVNLHAPAPDRPRKMAAAEVAKPEYSSLTTDESTSSHLDYVSADHPADQAPGARRSVSDQSLDLNALLAEHARLSATAGKATFLEGQLRDLEERNRALQEGLLSLANRNGWLESKLEEREQHIKLLTVQRARLPWWRRVFSVREAGA